VISESFGEEKVSTKVFEHILHRFGVTSVQALMVGDDIRRDMFWAHTAGYVTALQEQFVKYPAETLDEFSGYVDFRVRSISEICKLLLPQHTEVVGASRTAS